MRILFIGNQGGEEVLAFYRNMAREMECREPACKSVYIAWLNSERDWLQGEGVPVDCVYTFENWVNGRRHTAPDPDRFEREYPDANWAAVVASERAICDYSFLLGAVGHRPEKSNYTIRLVDNIVSLFEEVINHHLPIAIVCQTPDTIFSHIAFKVAKRKGIAVFGISPGWLFEQSVGQGGFFANDEYLTSKRMIDAYRCIKSRDLTSSEMKRVEDLLEQITNFRGRTAFYEKMRPDAFKGGVVTPNFRTLIPYIISQLNLDKDVSYIRIAAWSKTRANILRIWRRSMTKTLIQTVSLDDLPKKFVFYAMHFQPEQSTLAQGIYYSNQIALIENISKALPLGYTLVVKEHPVGRGRRPVWQYKHIAGLPNVELCDALGKEIIRRSSAVMTITGTVAIEGLALGKPVIVFGKSFYSYCDLIESINSYEQLHGVLHDTLVRRIRPSSDEYDLRLRQFLFSYIEGLIPHFPWLENAEQYGRALLEDIQRLE